MFNEHINTDYIYLAHKPSPAGYAAAMKKMGTARDNTLCVGDQIFTDVLGGNMADLRVVMVGMLSPKEKIQIVLKRYLEKIVLHFYLRKRR